MSFPNEQDEADEDDMMAYMVEGGEEEEEEEEEDLDDFLSDKPHKVKILHELLHV